MDGFGHVENVSKLLSNFDMLLSIVQLSLLNQYTSFLYISKNWTLQINLNVIAKQQKTNMRLLIFTMLYHSETLSALSDGYTHIIIYQTNL